MLVDEPRMTANAVLGRCLHLPIRVVKADGVLSTQRIEHYAMTCFADGHAKRPVGENERSMVRRGKALSFINYVDYHKIEIWKSFDTNGV